MSINLNNTTPAAPTGGTNVLFQRDTSGNISAYIFASQAVPAGNVDLTLQAANIGATPILPTPATGLYRVSVYVVETQAATSSSTMPSVVLSYKDGDTGTIETVTLTATSGANAVGTFASASEFISANTSAAISYSTTGYASSGVTPMKYALHIRIEQM